MLITGVNCNKGGDLREAYENTQADAAVTNPRLETSKTYAAVAIQASLPNPSPPWTANTDPQTNHTSPTHPTYEKAATRGTKVHNRKLKPAGNG